jgi:hypothetical protein
MARNRVTTGAHSRCRNLDAIVFSLPSWSAVDDGHVPLVVTLAGRRREVVQPFDLPGAHLDAVGGGVLLDTRDPLGSGNRRDVVTLREQPGQRHLRRCGARLGSDSLDLIDDVQVALEVFAGKARVGFAPVVVGELLGRADLPGEKTVAERRVGNEADAQLAEQRQELVLRITGPEGIFGLQRGDRMHGVSPPDCCGAGLGKADVADLALDHQLGQGADGVFDGCLRVDPVLVVQVDVVGAEPLQRPLDCDADARGAAVEDTGAATRVRDDAELRCEYDLGAAALDGPADQLLVVEGAVDLGGVEVGDAKVQRPMDGADGLAVAALCDVVVAGHRHGAESNAGDGKSADRDVFHGV